MLHLKLSLGERGWQNFQNDGMEAESMYGLLLFSGVLLAVAYEFSCGFCTDSGCLSKWNRVIYGACMSPNSSMALLL